MTDQLDPNRRGDTLRRISDASSPPRVGRVVAVRAHTGSESPPSNHEADVAVPPGGEVDQQHREIPVRQPGAGMAVVPREGDLVLVGYRNGDDPYVDGAIYGDADDDRAPVASAGDIRLRRKGATIEIASTDAGDDVVRVTRQPDDADAPDMGLELNLSTGEFQIGDGSGYGIVSDGAGNFQWFLESLDYVTDGSTLSW
ncbi:hypothetical protein DJ71_02325 [Halorubrum sp. E3]|nr:hypothetical protein DJ71_02325 [Halorubrum sp. E3]